MFSSKDWDRLIRGLARATENGRLEWAATRGGPGFSVESYLRGELIFFAGNAGTVYRLSGTGSGAPPFTLSVSERKLTQLKVIGEVRSQLTGGDDAASVNQALELLFGIVAEQTEAGSDVVTRLLEGLGEE